MEPGDILYIRPDSPRGLRHRALPELLGGFRAPDAKALVSSFADHLIDNEIRTERYGDPDLQPRARHGEIQPHELHRLRELMQQALDDETLFKEWFGTMISEAKHDLDVNPVEPDYSADEVADLLSQGSPPSRCRGCAASGSAARAAPAKHRRRSLDPAKRGSGRHRAPVRQGHHHPGRAGGTGRSGGLPATADPAGQPRLLVLRLIRAAALPACREGRRFFRCRPTGSCPALLRPDAAGGSDYTG